MTAETSYHETELFRQVAAGDEQSFTELVVHYGPQLEKAIFQVIQTEVPVKDILQDVFLHLWLDREKLAGLDFPRTWMFRIAYYRSYTWLRHQGVRTKVHGILKNEQVYPVASSEVEEHSAFRETKQLIQEAVQGLTPQAKRIYLLSRENNLRTNEIAESLGISPQTVKNTLTAALRHIRTYLQKKGVYIPVILLLLK